MFGAYYYSGDRINLLKEYFRILGPNRNGYLHIEGIKDKIYTPYGIYNLYDFLEAQFPKIFKVQRIDKYGNITDKTAPWSTSVLVIHKSTNETFPTELMTYQIELVDTLGANAPIINLRKIK